ncbi:MAG: hypothetical protein E6314_09210 [Enterobacter sp.]|nr:hypothetical protein [Enterobacter sp.]MDU7182096.1 hypothetical protein [Enterobacter roggenkampii]
MSNKYEDLIKNARMNADCGEHMSPAEVTTLLNVVETTLSALAAENAEMKEEISNITFMRDDDFFGSTQRAQEVMGRLVNIKTPATDASLAEVRASARNYFIGRIEWIIRNECNPDKTEAIINELQNFSDELKLEAAQ